MLMIIFAMGILFCLFLVTYLNVAYREVHKLQTYNLV